MKSSDITFKTITAEIEQPNGDNTREMDVIEIKYPDGKVVAFPATDKSPESDVRYCDMFPAKYQAFKNGDPDPDRVDQLQKEIDERQAELGTLRGGADKADKRVQENLGYGKVKPDADPHSTASPRESPRKAKSKTAA